MSARLMLILTSLALLAAASRAQDAPTTRPMNDAAANDISPAINNFMQPVEPAHGDDALRQKLKERHNTAVRLLELRVKEYHQGMTDASPVFEAARVVAESK